MIQTLEKPVAPETAVKPPPENRPARPEIYQGNVNKMEVFNNGENGQERAVRFQLKKGEQGLSFVLGTDTQDPKRVLNMDSLKAISKMTDAQYAETAILQQQENSLSVLTPDGQDIRLTQEGLKQNPYTIKLNYASAVKILDFDPEKNSILICKTKPELPPVTVIPVPTWKQKLLKYVVPPLIMATSVFGPKPVDVKEPPPPPIVRLVEVPQDQIPETLKCPATKEMTVAPGDSLTKLLVDVNGLPRYLTSDGKNLDVQKLYKDLACLLVVPENRPVIHQSDNTVAGMLDTAFQNRTLIGPVTPKMIFDLVDTLNAQRVKDLPQNANPQLVIIQPGQKFQIPDFRTQENPESIPQSSIPAPDLKTITTP